MDIGKSRPPNFCRKSFVSNSLQSKKLFYFEKISGIPVNSLTEQEADRLMHMKESLQKRIEEKGNYRRNDMHNLVRKYFDDRFKSISGITHMVPLRPTNDENIIDGIIIFAPQLFMKNCDLIKDAFKYFNDLGKKRIEMSRDQPEFWNELVSQAQPIFQKIKLYSADIKDLRPESF